MRRRVFDGRCGEVALSRRTSQVLDRSWNAGQTTARSQADLNDFNTLSHKQFRLRTLGGLTLDLPDGAEDRELATRRRKLAVLAYLAIVDKPVARATLIEL